MLASIFEKGGKAVGKIGKITPEQLKTTRRILRDLPVKDTRCSREEAAALLEKDFKRAFRKGYTPKDLCLLLKKASIIIPERLIARYQEPVVDGKESRELKPMRHDGSKEKNNTVLGPQIENIKSAKNVIPPEGFKAKPTLKSGRVPYKKFPIIPNTPEDSGVAKDVTPASKNEATQGQRPEPYFFRIIGVSLASP